jgi:hypothetical protein
MANTLVLARELLHNSMISLSFYIDALEMLLLLPQLVVVVVVVAGVVGVALEGG